MHRSLRSAIPRVFRLVTPAAGSLALSAALAVGCDAELATRCVGGSCAELAPNTASVSSAASAGTGGAGGAGGGAACFADCDVSAAGDGEGELPCAIEAIVESRCRHCHSDPPVNGAPFPLVTYADTQALYDSVLLGESQARFALIHYAVTVDYMPLDVAPLTPDEERQALLAWACACAPKRAPGEVCE